MNAREFIDAFGPAEAERVAIEAGTNMAYLRQIANRERRPSVSLAKKLSRASGGRLSFERLLATPLKREEAA